jgi:hypothetical protein
MHIVIQRTAICIAVTSFTRYPVKAKRTREELVATSQTQYTDTKLQNLCHKNRMLLFSGIRKVGQLDLWAFERRKTMR